MRDGSLAAQLSDQALKVVTDIGVPVLQRACEPTPQGGVEIMFRTANKNDLLGVKLALA